MSCLAETWFAIELDRWKEERTLITARIKELVPSTGMSRVARLSLRKIIKNDEIDGLKFRAQTQSLK